MNCVQCGNEMVDAFTAFTVLKDGTVYVTEDVPCLECPVCEHMAFTQEVARKLERYSSGRALPTSTYRAYRLKWGQPPIEIPSVTFQSFPNDKVVTHVGTTGVLAIASST